MKAKPLFGTPKRFNSIDKSQSILLYDSLNLFFSCTLSKAYGAFATSSGKPSAHIYGTFSRIRGHIKKFTKTGQKVALVFAWDNEPKKALEILPEYKLNRDERQVLDAEDLEWRLKEYRRFLSTFPCTFVESPEEEADNVIATLSTNYPRKRFHIMSSDKDLWQLLVKPNVKIVSLRKSELITEADILNKYGIKDKKEAYKIALYKAVMGDAGDNIPKIPRMPSKDFNKVLKEISYKTDEDCVEILLKRASTQAKTKCYDLLQENVNMVKRNLLLTRLKEDVALYSEYHPGHKVEMENFLTDYECHSVLDKGGYGFFFE